MLPSTLSNQNSLDPQVVDLAKAIRQTESGGNPIATGKSGEYGAYQYTPETWAKDSADAGVNVPLKQATLEQQNQVAYTKIKKMKDSGLNVGQIASVWNAGDAEPNAYTGTFSNGQPSKGINREGVRFDVPAYARSVASAYQTLKKGGQVGIDPSNPSSITNQTPQGDKDFLQKVSDILTTIFPGTKQIGEGVGTATANIGKLLQGQNPDIPVNVPAMAGGILESGAQVASAGLVGGSALSRIGGMAGLGAIMGAGSALSQGATSPVDIAKQGLIGGTTGGALGGAGELISKASQYLPYSIARKFLSGTSEETAQYAIDKGLGTPVSMLNRSNRNLVQVGNGIENILTNPILDGINAGAQDIYSGVLAKYPRAGLTIDNLGDELKKLAPLEKGLVDKLENEGLTPQELNRLKSAIGENTYKMRFDDPVVRAGKDIGNAAYASINDWLKNTLPAIRSDMPDITPLFDEYSKELQLNGALESLIRRGEKAKFIGLPEIIAMLGGSSILGPGGGIGAIAAEKAIRSPAVNLMAGNVINKLNNPIFGGLGRMGAMGLIGNVTGAPVSQK